MPDDRTSKRFPRIQSADARAIASKRRTNPQGFPVHVESDDGLTPPPQMIPLPPHPEDDIRESLRLIAEGLGQNTAAIGKVWPERGASERVDKIETQIAGYIAQIARHQQTLDEFLMPGVKDLMAASEAAGRAQVRTDHLLEQSLAKLGEISVTLKDLVTRIGRLEVSVEKLHDGHKTLTEDLEALDKRVTAEVEKLDVRVGALERARIDGAVAAGAVAAERKKWLSWGKAGIAGAIAVGSALVSNLDDIVRWLT